MYPELFSALHAPAVFSPWPPRPRRGGTKTESARLRAEFDAVDGPPTGSQLEAERESARREAFYAAIDARVQSAAAVDATEDQLDDLVDALPLAERELAGLDADYARFLAVWAAPAPSV